MKTAQKVLSMTMTLGLATWSGAILFSGGLTALGIFAFGSIFVGSAGHLVANVINLIPERKGKDKEVPASEKDGVKPQAGAVNA